MAHDRARAARLSSSRWGRSTRGLCGWPQAQPAHQRTTWRACSRLTMPREFIAPGIWRMTKTPIGWRARCWAGPRRHRQHRSVCDRAGGTGRLLCGDRGDANRGNPVFDAAFTGPEGIEGVPGTEIGLDTLSPLASYQSSYEAYRTQPSRKALITVTKACFAWPGAVQRRAVPAPCAGVLNLLVSSEDAPALVDAAARGARVRMVADVRRVPSRLRNVVASVKGSDPTAQPVAVMTPRSGWWHCASESGVVDGSLARRTAGAA